MKVVGYGICGPGEASRYMRETMEEFKRLCDVVVILCNNAGPAEKAMCYEYGFRMVQDNREWGVAQWKIKQDFLQREVSRYVDNGDMVVCLDMDETLDRRLTKQWLLEAPLDAYHVFVVDLWNDPQHFKLASCFWNVRIFRWNGDIEFKKKPVHCGLAPQWTYFYNRFAPFILLHKGLMDPKDRKRKIERYEKYDTNQIHLGHAYYAMLKSDTDEPFDEQSMHDTISAEVATYKQSRPRGPSIYMKKQDERFAYFRNSAGNTVDVPERHVAVTLKQPGMTFVGWADDAAKEIEELFSEDNDPTDFPDGCPISGHTYIEPCEMNAPTSQTPAQGTSASLEDLGQPNESRIPQTQAAGGEAPKQNRVGVERAARPVKRQTPAKKK